MDIGEILKMKRVELNLTQEDLAEEILVSRKSISNWETGKNLPDIENILKLCTLFDLNLNKLLEEDLTIMNNLKQAEISSRLKWWRFFTAQLIGISIIIFVTTGDFFKITLLSKVVILIITFSTAALNIFFVKEIRKVNIPSNFSKQIITQYMAAGGSLIISVISFFIGFNTNGDIFYKAICLVVSLVMFIMFILFLWGIKYVKVKNK